MHWQLQICRHSNCCFQNHLKYFTKSKEVITYYRNLIIDKVRLGYWGLLVKLFDRAMPAYLVLLMQAAPICEMRCCMAQTFYDG